MESANARLRSRELTIVKLQIIIKAEIVFNINYGIITTKYDLYLVCILHCVQLKDSSLLALNHLNEVKLISRRVSMTLTLLLSKFYLFHHILIHGLN